MAEGIRARDGSAFYARESYFQTAFEELRAELADVEDAGKRFFKKDNFRNRLHFNMDSELTRVSYWPFRSDIEAAVDLVIEGGAPVSAFLEHCSKVLDGMYALKGLDALSILFEPITYMGQDDDNTTGKRFAEFVAGASSEISKARKAARRQ